MVCLVCPVCLLVPAVPCPCPQPSQAYLLDSETIAVTVQAGRKPSFRQLVLARRIAANGMTLTLGPSPGGLVR